MNPASSFPPSVGRDVRLLLLGSLPGVASLQARQYYAHPRNQFWRLMGEVIGQDLPGLPYDKRLETLLRHRIGLWDVVKSAQRRGSLDAAIRNPVRNDLGRFTQQLPDLRAIAFNGGTAHNIGKRQLAGVNATVICLPSSSPAYAAMRYDAKRDNWLQLRNYL